MAGMSMNTPRLTQPGRIIAGMALLASMGCASVDRRIHDSTQRQPTTTVEIYDHGKLPKRGFQEIAELSVRGDWDNQSRRQSKLVEAAKQLGGDGLILSVEPVGSGSCMSPFRTHGLAFKGKVIVYK